MTEEMEVLFERLSALYEDRKFTELRTALLDMEPTDIAAFMEETLSDKDQIRFFRLLPKELASDVFVEIDSDTQEHLIKSFSDITLQLFIQAIAHLQIYTYLLIHLRTQAQTL